MKLRSLEDLMVAQLKILRGAEEQIVSTLPKFVAGASSSEAVEALEALVAGSRQQEDRLARIAEELGRKLVPRTCEPVAGMLEEMRILNGLKKTEPLVLDVALLSAGQRLLRHRLNAYRHARTLAAESGYAMVAELLDDSVSDQQNADADLTKRLTTLINPPLRVRVAEAAGEAARSARLVRPAEVVDRLLGVEVPRKASKPAEVEAGGG